MEKASSEVKTMGIEGPTVSRKSAPEYITGRRAFFKYREMGVGDASRGKLRVQVMSAEKGLTEPTGWYYHVCEGQFIFMLSGWVNLVFENGDEIRIGEGDSAYIPGGLRHNETATSDTFELIEVLVPADLRTESCDPPDGMAN
jgi:quercetin dioxygenase-like cupin family protein